MLALHLGNKHTPSLFCYRFNSIQYLSKDCWFKSVDCHACEKRGYIMKACRKRGQPHSTQQGQGKHSKRSSKHTHQLTAEDSKTGGGSYFLFTLSAPRAAPITMPVTMNGAEVLMEVDTGASFSIMSKTTFTNKWKRDSPSANHQCLCKDAHR